MKGKGKSKSKNKGKGSTGNVGGKYDSGNGNGYGNGNGSVSRKQKNSRTQTNKQEKKIGFKNYGNCSGGSCSTKVCHNCARELNESYNDNDYIIEDDDYIVEDDNRFSDFAPWPRYDYRVGDYLNDAGIIQSKYYDYFSRNLRTDLGRYTPQQISRMSLGGDNIFYNIPRSSDRMVDTMPIYSPPNPIIDPDFIDRAIEPEPELILDTQQSYPRFVPPPKPVYQGNDNTVLWILMVILVGVIIYNIAT